MVVAAAGLVLVGLLAAALFSPGKDEPKDETTAKDDEDIKPVKPKTAEVEIPMYGGMIAGDDTPGVSETSPETGTDNANDTGRDSEPEETNVPDTPNDGGIIEHTIKPGDMISKLAVKYNCKSSDIYKVNDGLTKDNAHKIRVGQVIRVPVNGEGMNEVAAPTQPASGDSSSGSTASADGEYYPRRVITAEAGDTVFMLAVEHYGAKHMFRKIVEANPEIDWTNRLSGGEQVLLPEHGAPTGKKATSGDTVERNSLIPPKR